MRASTRMVAGLATLGLLLASSASAQDPYDVSDDTWISLDGTVTSVEAGEFMLDYGDGVVRVEIDSPDEPPRTFDLMEGAEVRVEGMVDDDFLETTSIEARSVYVEDLNTRFRTSAADEEEPIVMPYAIDLSHMVLEGRITEVGEDSFTVGTGTRSITVRTGGLENDPLDAEGFQQLQIGDRVLVTGRMAPALFETGELLAESVTTLRESGEPSGNR